ncbi:MAG TPA: hypothetical protein PKN32_13520 [Bacteroidales bacterium]|nr:hypothetical protein [Bacteroidales bacterium]
MKKVYTQNKWKNHLKRRSDKAIRKLSKAKKGNKPKKKLKLHEKLFDYEDKKQKKTFKLLPAPTNFSFIDNTEEVLKYLKDSEKYFKQKRGVNFDKTNVEVMTSDAIALFIAFISGKHKFRGNAPRKENLKKLFEESGFYDFVATKSVNKGKGNNEFNLLHRETNNIVEPEIAGEAVYRGIHHTGLSMKDTDPVYDTLIECMQNTNNHASLNKYGNCNWWLYVYNDPEEKITKYSFVDLGVGIFSSLVANGLVRKFFKSINMLPNIQLVDDLLNGKIQSRIDEDNQIRGKGIPQIVEYARTDYFKRFFIIANDVKINVKTGEKWQLNTNINGTFLYWELQNIINNGN